MWVGGMPVADSPLWQLAQPVVTPRWVNIAPPQVRVVWQASHSRSVTICVGPLPCAITPLWQVEQLPRTWGGAKLTAGLPAMGGWQVGHWSVGRRGVGGVGGGAPAGGGAGQGAANLRGAR